MAGIHWTPEEVDDVRAMDYAAFVAKYGPDRRTSEAFRKKKERLEPISVPNPEPRLEEWEELFTHLESAEASRRALGASEASVRISSPDDAPFALAFMSDIHAGGGGVEYQRFREDLETIRDTDGVGVVINGDLWENAKHMMKSGEALYHGAFNSPREQYYYTLTRLSMIANKIAVISAGNHDTRDGLAGIDRLPDLCRELGVAYFSEKGGTIYLTVGSQEYVIAVKHEWAGNSQLNKSNRARRMWMEWTGAWENADVVTMGHLHQPDLHTSTQKGRDVHYVQSGTYKYVHDGYSEAKGFKPAYGVPVVVFHGDSRRIIPFSDFHAGLTYLRAVRAEAEERAERPTSS